MAISLGNNQEFEKSSYFTQIIKIASIEQLEPLPNAEFVLQIKFDIGKEFQPQMRLFGSMKRDGKGDIEGWGSAFKINNLLDICGCYKGLSEEQEAKLIKSIENGTIPVSILQKCKGTEVLVLKYAKEYNGKLYYQFYSNIYGAKGNKDKLIKDFLSTVEKGYVKDYDPEAINIENNDLPAAESETEPEQEIEDIF